jgi:predicted nucleic acid-binding protein
LKLIDTNVFVRAMVVGRTPQDALMREAALRLLAGIDAGLEEALTHESVVNEVLFVLCSPRHYGLSRPEALNRFLSIFNLDGLGIVRKRLYADALQLFGSVQALDFTDCVLAIYARDDELELVTFDRRLAQAAGVEVYS